MYHFYGTINNKVFFTDIPNLKLNQWLEKLNIPILYTSIMVSGVGIPRNQWNFEPGEPIPCDSVLLHFSSSLFFFTLDLAGAHVPVPGSFSFFLDPVERSWTHPGKPAHHDTTHPNGFAVGHFPKTIDIY